MYPSLLRRQGQHGMNIFNNTSRNKTATVAMRFCIRVPNGGYTSLCSLDGYALFACLCLYIRDDNQSTERFRNQLSQRYITLYLFSTYICFVFALRLSSLLVCLLSVEQRHGNNLQEQGKGCRSLQTDIQDALFTKSRHATIH